MKAEIYIVDENGKRVKPKPILLEPFDIRDNGIVTTYTFAFELIPTTIEADKEDGK